MQNGTKNLEVGTSIFFNGQRGIVEKIDNDSKHYCTLKMENGTTHKLTKKAVNAALYIYPKIGEY